MAEKLKDKFLQPPFLRDLAGAIGEIYPDFDQRLFRRRVSGKAWKELELKGRLRRAAEALGETLPSDYREAVGILRRVEGQFGDFDHLVFAEYVGCYGGGDFTTSMAALEVFTRSTAEFAIRPFLREELKRTLARMQKWSRSKHVHVRRLASEGCRPRLPWAIGVPALKKDPSQILPILTNLREDPSEMVRRSVANNLNDISKDHPELVLKLAARWLKQAPGTQPLLKHALRGLLKNGDARAMKMFGLGREAKVKIERFALVPARVKIGGQGILELKLRASAKTSQRLRLEYEVTYARPRGKTATKVFQIKEATAAAGEVVQTQRKLSFADLSTRTHHRGEHRLTLAVNGVRKKSVRFDLT